MYIKFYNEKRYQIKLKDLPPLDLKASLIIVFIVQLQGHTSDREWVSCNGNLCRPYSSCLLSHQWQKDPSWNIASLCETKCLWPSAGLIYGRRGCGRVQGLPLCLHKGPSYREGGWRRGGVIQAWGIDNCCKVEKPAGHDLPSWADRRQTAPWNVAFNYWRTGNLGFLDSFFFQKKYFDK